MLRLRHLVYEAPSFDIVCKCRSKQLQNTAGLWQYPPTMKIFKPVLFVVPALTLWAASLFAQASDTRGMKVLSAEQSGVVGYDPARFHALIIGINNYSRWAKLRTAVNDATSVADALVDNYGFPAGQVRRLLDENATRRNILQELDRISELGPEDSVLIYYAGHGWMDEHRNGFWIPVDAPEDDKFAYVSNAQVVQEYFKKYAVRHLLVVSDSCFSGALLRGTGAKREADWKIPAGFRKPSRWVITSGDLAPVPDDAGTGHSPFATRLLQYLRYGDEPAFGIYDLFSFVKHNLASGAICEPLDTPSHMPGGEFVLARLDTSIPKPPPDKVLPPNIVLEPKVSPSPKENTSASSNTRTIDLGDGIELAMVLVNAGRFEMGTESGGSGNERPVRTVHITRDFWMGKTEVTQRQWKQLMGKNPSHFKGDDLPVEKVSWNDSVKFCEALTRREREANRLPQGAVYRLPTEAEWEYAARGGGKGMNTLYAGSDNLDTVAWHRGNSGRKTQNVGTKAANELGLHDMSGNVLEWVHDKYQDSYKGLETTDPSGLQKSGLDRVDRGGSWDSSASYCRVAYRCGWFPSRMVNTLGLRVVLAAPVQ